MTVNQLLRIEADLSILINMIDKGEQPNLRGMLCCALYQVRRSIIECE